MRHIPKIKRILNYRLDHSAVLFGGFLLAFNSAQALCPDCEHQPTDILPNIIRGNDQMIKILILISSLLLLIYGIYKAYGNRPLTSRDGNIFFVLIDLIKFIFSILFKVFLLYVITYVFSVILYFVSNILATMLMSFYNVFNYSSDIFYGEGFKYVWLAIYGLMAYSYALFLLRRNKTLNVWIIAAVTFFVFAMVYMVIPSTIVG